MADPTGWNPTQISSMASAVSTEADTINGLAGSAPPPHQESFGKLLAPPASNAFPYTTDGIDSFLTGAGAAVGRMGDGLDHSATSYQSAEDQAVAFASQIAGAGERVRLHRPPARSPSLRARTGSGRRECSAEGPRRAVTGSPGATSDRS